MLAIKACTCNNERSILYYYSIKMCMNLSALPFLAGSVTEVHAGTCTCVLADRFCFGQEKTVGVRRMTRFTIQGQFFTKKVVHLLPSWFSLLNICRLPPRFWLESWVFTKMSRVYPTGRTQKTTCALCVLPYLHLEC